MGNPRYSAARNAYVRSADSTSYAADGAITVADGEAVITKTSLAVLTLAPPVAGDDGLRLTIVSRTAFAHTVTITEGIGGRGASFDVLTFAGIGDSITLLASNAHWAVVANSGVTIA